MATSRGDEKPLIQQIRELEDPTPTIDDAVNGNVKPIPNLGYSDILSSALMKYFGRVSGLSRRKRRKEDDKIREPELPPTDYSDRTGITWVGKSAQAYVGVFAGVTGLAWVSHDPIGAADSFKNFLDYINMCPEGFKEPHTGKIAATFWSQILIPTASTLLGTLLGYIPRRYIERAEQATYQTKKNTHCLPLRE